MTESMKDIIRVVVNVAFFAAWPMAAYISSRIIRRRPVSEASRFVVMTGLLFAFIGSFVSTIVITSAALHPWVFAVYLVVWVSLPFILLAIELAFRRRTR